MTRANLITSFLFAVAFWLAWNSRFSADATAQQAGPWLAWAAFVAVFGVLCKIAKIERDERS